MMQRSVCRLSSLPIQGESIGKIKNFALVDSIYVLRHSQVLRVNQIDLIIGKKVLNRAAHPGIPKVCHLKRYRLRNSPHTLHDRFPLRLINSYDLFEVWLDLVEIGLVLFGLSECY